MITSIKIKNFRNMQDFSLDLNKFTCLIGENGAGKTTVLHALEFIKSLAQGNTRQWLKSMRWKPNEINYRHEGTNITRLIWEEPEDTEGLEWIKDPISFSVTARLNGDAQDPLNFEWSGDYLWNIFQCVNEKVLLNDKPLLNYDDNNGDLQVKLLGKSAESINNIVANHEDFFKLPISFMEYEGSFLSLIGFSSRNISKNSLLQSSYIMDFKKSLLSIDPHKSINSNVINEDEDYSLNRKKVSEEQLPSLFDNLTSHQKEHINKVIRDFYPRVKKIFTEEVKGVKKATIRLTIKETRGFEYDHKHADDGLLRLVTIFTRLFSKSDGLFLFDEIENGINPSIVEKLIALFIQTEHQVIITTHSPVILNWIPEEVAKESTFLIYRGQNGSTKSTKYFELSEPNKELEYMGPGEVFSYLSTKGLDEQSRSELSE